MHGRHRNHGNGYRSSSSAMGGVAAPPRISPENSFRGHATYDSDPQNYSRGFGRGQPKPFQPHLSPPPPSQPHGGDVFMEAGRLATEYLVSKGLLPPDVFSGKWHGGNLKNQMSFFQFPRELEGGNPQERRMPTVTRLGGPVPAARNRRFHEFDDYSRTGSRDHTEGSRKIGSFRRYGSESSREVGGSGMSSEQARNSSPDRGADADSYSGYPEEQQVGNDDGTEEKKSLVNELRPKLDDAGTSGSVIEENKSQHNVPFNTDSLISEKKIPPKEVDPKLLERDNCMNMADADFAGVKPESSDVELGKETVGIIEETPIQDGADEDQPPGETEIDLLTFCRFVKLPTRKRSASRFRGSKINPVLIGENKKTSDMDELPEETEGPIENGPSDVTLGDPSMDQDQSLKSLNPIISEVPPMEDAGQLKSRSFSDRPLESEQESSEAPRGLDQCCSIIIGRGEKRALECSSVEEGAKKQREWAPSNCKADEYFHLWEKQQGSSNEGSSRGEAFLDAAKNRLTDISLFTEGGGEETHPFSGSFKICDLNLMETSDANEKQDDADSIRIFQTLPQNKEAAARVDVDFSESSSCVDSDKHVIGAEGKVVEVIDLESDSPREEKGFNSQDRKVETIFSGLESFPEHQQGVDEISDTHDGYGLMLSRLIGADIPTCSSVSQDINSLHSDMDLHNGEGILGDDDSIYMSLGEIPISFLRVWEQPPSQDYDKHF